MAIYGAGSMWDGTEMKDNFFINKNYEIGWEYNDAKDLYEIVSFVKIGDIIYLKANSPGSRNIRVKGIGMVTKTLAHHFMERIIECEVSECHYSSPRKFFIKVNWIVTEEFFITIPNNDGKLTNIRAATFYEEYLPSVQDEIMKKLFTKISPDT